MRTIRNECAAYMTRDQSRIGRLRQIAFWRRLRRADGILAYLFWRDDEPVAFGILRWLDGAWWLTGGVKESERGKGYGREVFTFLSQAQPGPLYLEVLATNQRARNLYESLGYKVIGGGSVIAMRRA